MKQWLPIILFMLIWGAVSADAQTNLNGRYVYQGKQGDVLYNLVLEFEGKNAVYYSFNYKGSGTIRGDWTLENGIIKIVLRRNGSNWTVKLKHKGIDLEAAEDLPKMEIKEIPELKEILIAKGTVFKKDVSEPNAPTLKTEEISKRILKLIKSVNTIEDISPENIERQMQIKVSFGEEDRSRYGFGGKIEGASDWLYNVYAYSSENNRKTDTLRFSFDYQFREPPNPDLSPVCVMDFNAYSKELKDAGFSKSFPIYGVHSRLSGWHFERDETLINFSLNGGWEPYPQQCVKSILISIAR